jgi:hypothetical protein
LANVGLRKEQLRGFVMFWNRFLSCSLVFGSMTLPQKCIAQGAFNSASEIAGIALGLPAEQAKKVLEERFPGAVLTDETVSFGVNPVQRNVTVSFAADITPIEDQQINSQKNQQSPKGPIDAYNKPVAEPGHFAKT